MRVRHFGWLIAAVGLVGVALVGCDSGDGGAFGSDSEGGTGETDTGASSTETSGPEDADAGETGDIDEAMCEDCGPGGSCLHDGEDSYCLCADGYEPGATATLCVPCPELDSPDIDMDIVDLSGPITVNGAQPPLSVFDSGELYLFNPLTLDEVYLGETSDASFDARVLAGRYDLIYRSDGTPKETVPSNTHAVLEQGIEVVEDDSLTKIDIEARALVASLTVDGEAAPAVEVDDGVLRLVSEDGPDEVVLGRTSGEMSAVVIPGTYRVVYSADTVGDNMPADSWKVFGAPQIIEPPGEEATTQVLDLSIETQLYAPAVTLNGNAFPAQEVDDGVLWLVSGANRIVLGRTSVERSPVRVIEGSVFGLVYAADTPGDNAPVNRWATVAVGVGTNETVDIHAHWVAPQLEVDGIPAPDSEVDDGTLWLVDPYGGDEAPLGLTSGSVGANVIAHDYDLQYRAQTVGDTMPANTRATLMTPLVVEADWQEIVSVETVALDGVITVGGEPAPDAEFSSGRLMLERGEDTVLLGKTSSGSYSRRVLAGTYDLYYSVEFPGQGLPANEHGPLLLDLALGADQSLPVDIPRRELAGALTIEQSSVPNSPADSGRLYLRTASVGDGASLGDLGEQSYSIGVIPGSYSVYYRSDASSGLTPANSNGRVACFSVE